MSMTRLIIVRHGQSLANAKQVFAGHSDYDLSELGHTQARLAAEYLAAHERIDAIYASDLLRAYHTATPTAELLGLPVIKDTGLREIFAGEWEGKSVFDLMENYPEDFRAWKENYSLSRPTGGESVPEVYRRIVPHICSLAEQNEGKCILLATHATVVRSFEAYTRGFGAEETGRVEFVSNASINIYTYDKGSVTLERSDITEHLGDLVTRIPRVYQA